MDSEGQHGKSIPCPVGTRAGLSSYNQGLGQALLCERRQKKLQLLFPDCGSGGRKRKEHTGSMWTKLPAGPVSGPGTAPVSLWEWMLNYQVKAWGL